MLKNIIKLIRPQQWIKNGVVLAGLIFSGQAANPGYQNISLLTLATFCLLASAVYTLNDIVDINRDKQHPLKKNRPLAAGDISVPVAGMVGLFLALGGLMLSYYIGLGLFYVALAYLVLNVMYTFVLKNIVIIDVMSIAAGFVLRALAGAVAINVEFSNWLLISTFVLALFLGLGKRRHEIMFLEKDASSHRKILDNYSPYLLDQLIGVVTASTVITYLFYTLSEEVKNKLNTEYLYITIPFVIYGIFRYLYLVHKEEKGGSPTKLLLADRPLLADVVLWLASIILILYFI
ncbi:MAG: decaprenyl-phosphate phosphoribosyltransferase [candidate division Zixibacteria bacterium]|nr:decaprenyl-phosphate phosphoribosyltransferase [candidate division Zixibacteria bacterium]